MDVQIRKPRRKDLKEVADIYMEEFSKPPYSEKWSFKIAFEKIKYFLKTDDIFVALVNSKVIGFIVCNFNFWFPGKTIFIEELAIREKFQGKGIGKKLLKYVEDYYTERGVESIVLLSNKNSKAYDFYKNLNYKVEKENVFMGKKLSSRAQVK